MKRILYTLAGIALLVSCAKEVEQDLPSDNVYVPLNITIQTKAGGSGSGTDHDINSIRIVAFKNTGTPANDLVVLNEYYGFGFGVEDQGTEGRYTVSVKPTLELDVNTDFYYVYAVLNEDDYRVVLSGTDTTTVKSNLESLSSRAEMVNLLNTPAVYPEEGVKDAPICLMSGCKELDFSAAGAKDRPMDVHFGLYGEDSTNPAPLDRTMAQITVESIQSVESTPNASDMALLPKIFVLDVQLVNVPKGIAWGSEGGVTGGKIELPIGKATAADTVKVSGGSDVITNYYPRVWDGYVYKDVEVIESVEQRMTANYYRTAATGYSAWGFYDDRDGATPITKYTYECTETEPTAPSPVVTKPFGFPTLSGDGKKWQYTISKFKNGDFDGNDNKGEAKLQDYGNDKMAAYAVAYADYLAHLPNDEDNGGTKQNPIFVTAEAAAAYHAYWPLKEQYDIAKAAYDAAAAGVYTAAETGRKSIDVQYAAGNSVDDLLADLEAIFQRKTYYSTDKYTLTGLGSNHSAEYCTPDRWKINLGDSYYVPENIQTSSTNATCVKVTLALAAPTIDISNVPLAKLPEADDATGGTYTYYFDHYYQTKQDKNNPSVLTKQTLELAYTGNVGDNAHKIKKTKTNNKGEYIDPDNVNFSIATLFELDGHIVDADDETIECTAATTNNRYHVYIDGESFWRTGTGLTAMTTVDQNQNGAVFNWNIPTSGTYVKEFLIPVNNAQFDSDYSIRRNTKYTVKLQVGATTLSRMSAPAADGSIRKPSAPELSISASVTTETMTENED